MELRGESSKSLGTSRDSPGTPQGFSRDFLGTPQGLHGEFISLNMALKKPPLESPEKFRFLINFYRLPRIGDSPGSFEGFPKYETHRGLTTGIP